MLSTHVLMSSVFVPPRSYLFGSMPYAVPRRSFFPLDLPSHASGAIIARPPLLQPMRQLLFLCCADPSGR
jgi:hypothetical protein